MQLPSEWISTRFVLYFPFSTTPFPSYPFSHRVCLPTSLDSKMYQALHLPSSLVEGSNWNSWTQLLSLFPYFLPPLSSSHSLPPSPSLSLSPSLFCSYFFTLAMTPITPDVINRLEVIVDFLFIHCTCFIHELEIAHSYGIYVVSAY